MRFFLFFLFSYFYTENTIGPFNSFFNFKGKNVLFSNNTRLNIDRIPYRNHLIVKKFDVANFNFKTKPVTTNNIFTNFTDSKIDRVKTSEKIIVVEAPILKKKDNHNKRSIIKENNDFLLSKNFKKIANNLAVMVKDHTEEVPTEEIIPKEEENKIASEKLEIIETINKAIEYNPRIKAQRASYESSKENLKQIYSGIFPSIEMNSVSYTHLTLPTNREV